MSVQTPAKPISGSISASFTPFAPLQLTSPLEFCRRHELHLPERWPPPSVVVSVAPVSVWNSQPRHIVFLRSLIISPQSISCLPQHIAGIRRLHRRRPPHLPHPISLSSGFSPVLIASPCVPDLLLSTPILFRTIHHRGALPPPPPSSPPPPPSWLPLRSLDPPNASPMAASCSCERHCPRRAATSHLPGTPLSHFAHRPALLCRCSPAPLHAQARPPLPLFFSPVALSFNDKWTPPVISLSLSDKRAYMSAL